MSVYALSANGKESRKMIRDPGKNPDDPGSRKESGSPPKSNRFLPGLTGLLFIKFQSKSVYNFWRYCVHKTRLHTHTCTHGQTHAPEYITSRDPAESAADNKTTGTIRRLIIYGF